MTDAKSDMRKCEACGSEFSCGAATSEPCWCLSVKLNDDQLKALRRDYQDCLCPECLQKVAKDQPL